MLVGTFINIPFAYKDLLNFEIEGIVPVILAALTGFFWDKYLLLGDINL